MLCRVGTTIGKVIELVWGSELSDGACWILYIYIYIMDPMLLLHVWKLKRQIVPT